MNILDRELSFLGPSGYMKSNEQNFCRVYGKPSDTVHLAIFIFVCFLLFLTAFYFRSNVHCFEDFFQAMWPRARPSPGI